jgi:uncharacterized membrane protein
VGLSRYFRLRSSDQHQHPVGRLELFSDGILAIAATLLVLTLAVPAQIGDGGLREVVWSQRYTFVAILIGFFEIGGSWLMSRRLARITESVDHWVTLIWLGAIFTATLIPFTTLVLARSFGRGDFYVGVFAVSAVTWLAIVLSTAAVLYVKKMGMLRPEAEATYRPYVRMLWAAVAVWTVTVPLSIAAPWVAFALVLVGYAIGLSPLVTEGRDAPGDPAIVVEETAEARRPA